MTILLPLLGKITGILFVGKPLLNKFGYNITLIIIQEKTTYGLHMSFLFIDVCTSISHEVRHVSQLSFLFSTTERTIVVLETFIHWIDEVLNYLCNDTFLVII